MNFNTKIEHHDPYARLSPANLSSEFGAKKLNVLISGGGYGIGASIGRSFAEARVASIVIAGRTESKLKATAKELSAGHPNVKIEYRVVDVSSDTSVKAMFASIKTTLDVLVNNAGFLSKPENFVNADMKEWWQSFEVNVLGTAMVTQRFLQARAKQNAKEEAVIINVNTVGAYSVLAPLLSAYSGSKAAMWRMMEVIAQDAKDTTVLPGGARFISLHPGAVDTAMFDKSELEKLALFEKTNVQLAADFTVWAASEEAAFLSNRFAWVNWDVDELVARKEEIVEKDMLRTGMS